MNGLRSKEDQCCIEQLDVFAYKVPTATPESDGTLAWDNTTLILVKLQAGDKTGQGYTYADVSTGYFIDKTLRELVLKADVMNIPEIFSTLTQSVRNNGNCGITRMAISAVDCACWDLKAKLLNVSVASLLGKSREAMPIYGSGGFTSYSIKALQQQLSGWVEAGIRQVKMKIGREPETDLARVKAAKEAIGNDATLFVDANGAYDIQQALEKAHQFADLGVTWLEEPVSSDHLSGLAFIRKHSPAGMNIAAGEYGYNLYDFKHMLDAEAVDILQADATRCGGITGFLLAGNLCRAFQLPFSSHCAPALHLHATLALPYFYVAEYFYDHVRIEQLFFDQLPQPVDGMVRPDLSRPGLGLDFKYADAASFKI